MGAGCGGIPGFGTDGRAMGVADAGLTDEDGAPVVVSTVWIDRCMDPAVEDPLFTVCANGLPEGTGETAAAGAAGAAGVTGMEDLPGAEGRE